MKSVSFFILQNRKYGVSSLQKLLDSSLTIPILSDIRQDPNVDVVTTCFKMCVPNEIVQKKKKNYKLFPKGAVLNIKCFVKNFRYNIAVCTLKTGFLNHNFYLLASWLVFLYPS